MATQKMSAQQLTADELVVRRVLAAPRERVFDAWLDPAGLAQWMAPRLGSSATAEVDARAGGRFRIVMQHADGSTEHTGEYLSLEPPSRLSFTWASVNTDMIASEVTVEFLEHPAGTRLVLTHRKLPAAKIDAHRKGWTAITSKLSEYLNPGVEIADSAGVSVRFEGRRCIHSRFCVLWQPQVYKANVKGPWIDPAADSVEAVAAVAHNCPSGAIQYERHDGQPDERAPPVNLINVRENGPLAFRAEIILDEKAIGYRATLCRCGASQNKPFCDNSHHDLPFTASGEPQTIDTPSLESRDGPLKIKSQPNGPLRIRGNMEICSGTGRTVKRSIDEALCRCGQSANKPYCDGTHKRVGFVAP